MAVNDFFGDPVPGAGPTGTDFFGDPVAGGAPAGPRAPTPGHSAEGFFDEITAKWQQSNTGMWWRKKMPDTFSNPDLPWYDRAAGNLMGLIGDGPGMLLGAGVAAAIPVPGVAKKALMGAGTFAAPAMIREAQMDYYGTGHIDWAKVGKVGAKSAAVGALTFMAGGAVGGMLPEATTLLGKAGAAAATGTAELGAMTGAQSVLDWKMPSAQDFFDNAVLIYGMKGAREVGVPALKKIYESGGNTPVDVANDMVTDSKTAQEVLAGQIPAKYAKTTSESEARLRTPGEKPAAPAPAVDEPTAITHIADKMDVLRNDFNLRHFDTEEGMHGVLAILTEEQKDVVETARRGTVSHEQTMREGQIAAEEMAKIVGGKTREIGDAGNAATVIAHAKLLTAAYRNMKQASVDLAALHDDVQAGKATPDQMAAQLADYMVKEQQVNAAASDYLGNTAEIGRAMNAIRLVKKAGTDVKAIQEALAEAGKGGAKAALERALIVSHTEKMASGVQLIKASSYFDKTVEGFKANILGPTSMVRNMASNVMFGLWRIPQTIGGAAVSTMSGSGNVQYRQAVGEVHGMVTGLYAGLQAGMKTLKAGYFDETPAEKVAREASPEAQSETHIKGLIGTDPDSTAVAKVFGKAQRTSFTLLSSMDAMSSTIVKYMTAYSLAAKNAGVKNILSPDYYHEALKDVIDPRTGQPKVFKPTEGGPESDVARAAQASEMMKLMTDEALRSTFQTQLSPWARRMLAGLYDNAITSKLMPFMFPFVKTPVNVYSEAMRQLPILGAASARQRADWEKGGAARDRAIGEHLLGLTMTMTIFGLVANGTVTGGGPADPDARAGWMQTHKPYSVKVGGNWYSYNYIEPFATSIGMMADLHQASDYMSDNEYALAAKAVGLGFVNQVTHKSFLQTLQAFGALTDPTTPDNPWATTGGSIVGGFIPSGVSYAGMLMDDHQRETRTFLDRIMLRIPKVREGLMPKRDLFGEEFPHNKWLDAAGIQTMPVPGDLVRNELSRMGYAPKPMRNETPDTEFRLGGSKQHGMDVIPGILEGRVPISDAQFDAIRTDAGKMAYPVLEEMFSHPGWPSVQEPIKRIETEKIFSKMRKIAVEKSLTSEQYEQGAEKALETLNKK